MNQSGGAKGWWARGVAGALWVAFVLCVHPQVTRATVEVNVTHVGFPSGPSHVARASSWTPILVDLALTDATPFSGTVRVYQPDRDGDRAIDLAEVHLQPGDKAGTHRVFLYAMLSPDRMRSRVWVELTDEKGRAAQVLSQGVLTHQAELGGVEVLHDDAILVLSLSEEPMGYVSRLEGRSYGREVRVAHMGPSELPDHWVGLEGVDYIVWDVPRPQHLDPAQMGALINWIQHGGTLLVAASQTMQMLVSVDDLYDMLPVDYVTTESVKDLPTTRRVMANAQPVSEGALAHAVGLDFARCTARPGAEVLAAEDDLGLTMARWPVGRGHVVFSGAQLKDLFATECSPALLFANVFHLPPQPNEGIGEPRSLHDGVSSAVSFAMSGSAYMLVAWLFSLVYLAASTFGTWGALGKKRRQHAWLAFAAAGGGTAVLGVLAVGSLHGIGDRLHQVSVVDVEAGQTHGFATAMFGLRTGLDKRVDLWLPSDDLLDGDPGPTDCLLRPTPDPFGFMTSLTSYADPIEYRVHPTNASIENLRVRSTLKRLEGRWAGSLEGRVQASVRLARGSEGLSDVRVATGSYVFNDLGVDLKNCYLIYSTYDIYAYDLRLGRRATATQRDCRDEKIYALEVGTLPAGEKVSLAPRCNPAGTSEEIYEHLKRNCLGAFQSRWVESFKAMLIERRQGGTAKTSYALGQTQQALLLASTVGEWDASKLKRHGYTSTALSRDRLRQLDMRSHINTRYATLIGFAADPGPVHLKTRRTGGSRWRSLRADPRHSWTMYRVRIPVAQADPASHARPVSDETNKPDEAQP